MHQKLKTVNNFENKHLKLYKKRQYSNDIEDILSIDRIKGFPNNIKG